MFNDLFAGFLCCDIEENDEGDQKMAFNSGRLTAALMLAGVGTCLGVWMI